jgi:AcrR family transcriptional regulator
MNTEPRTRRGRETRERIVATAAELIGEGGVHATSLEDVIIAAGVSKGQLYHYFANKDELVRAVIARQTDSVLAAQMPTLASLTSWGAIARWFDEIVALQEERACRGGCPIGSLASELADHNEEARRDLVQSFVRWEDYLVRGLAAMHAGGALIATADPATLATATMAAIQGGLLLAQTHQSSRPLRVALDAAFAYLQLYRAS